MVCWHKVFTGTYCIEHRCRIPGCGRKKELRHELGGFCHQHNICQHAGCSNVANSKSTRYCTDHRCIAKHHDNVSRRAYLENHYDNTLLDKDCQRHADIIEGNIRLCNSHNYCYATGNESCSRRVPNNFYCKRHTCIMFYSNTEQKCYRAAHCSTESKKVCDHHHQLVEFHIKSDELKNKLREARSNIAEFNNILYRYLYTGDWINIDSLPKQYLPTVPGLVISRQNSCPICLDPLTSKSFKAFTCQKKAIHAVHEDCLQQLVGRATDRVCQLCT